MVHSHFSQGILCKSDLYKGKTVKSLKLDPSMLKLRNRKTGPDLKIIYTFWWIFFSAPTFYSPLCVYCVSVREDQSGSQHLSLKETSSPCVTTVQRKQTNVILPAQSLLLVSSIVHHLCNVGVHFTIFWRPRQVFSFY